MSCARHRSTGFEPASSRRRSDTGLTALEEKFFGPPARRGRNRAASPPHVLGMPRRADGHLEASVGPSASLGTRRPSAIAGASGAGGAGVFIEFDALGWTPGGRTFITAIEELLAAGHGDRCCSRMTPVVPAGQPTRHQKPYTYLWHLRPQARSSGVDNATIRMLTERIRVDLRFLAR